MENDKSKIEGNLFHEQLNTDLNGCDINTKDQVNSIQCHEYYKFKTKMLSFIENFLRGKNKY